LLTGAELREVFFPVTLISANAVRFQTSLFVSERFRRSVAAKAAIQSTTVYSAFACAGPSLRGLRDPLAI
jgi:hypothetical protein